MSKEHQHQSSGIGQIILRGDVPLIRESRLDDCLAWRSEPAHPRSRARITCGVGSREQYEGAVACTELPAGVPGVS